MPAETGHRGLGFRKGGPFLEEVEAAVSPVPEGQTDFPPVWKWRGWSSRQSQGAGTAGALWPACGADAAGAGGAGDQVLRWAGTL